MGKQMYKVELTGWVVKNNEDSDVVDWTLEAIIESMVGFEIQATLVDHSHTDQDAIVIASPMPQSITPIIHVDTNDINMNEVEVMDIKLDTKGMSL